MDATVQRAVETVGHWFRSWFSRLVETTSGSEPRDGEAHVSRVCAFVHWKVHATSGDQTPLRRALCQTSFIVSFFELATKDFGT